MSKGLFAQRRDNRVVALLYLYRWEISPAKNLADDVRQFFVELESKDVPIIGEPDEVKFLAHFAKPRAYYGFTEEIVQGVILHLDDINARIKTLAQNWDFERIAKIDLAILRMAIFEMLHRKDIPPVVSINEAIDLSKQFSNADSKRFINGILDRLKSEIGRDARKADDGV